MERVMIIDSDIRQMRELNDGLSGDFQILNCSRGSKALELFRLFQPAALVLDPNTFELKGRDFVRQIRVFPQGEHIPVLALTRFTTLRHIEESFDWGVDMIFSKPCSGKGSRKSLMSF